MVVIVRVGNVCILVVGISCRCLYSGRGWLYVYVVAVRVRVSSGGWG